MHPLVVYGTFGAWGLPSVSPFVLKLETWLRIANLPYERRAGNPLKAPTGKVPYAEIDGVKVGDSQLIIDALAAKRGIDLDGHLTAAQRGAGHALRRMLEEATYFPIIRYRWIHDEGWATQVAAFRPNLPALAGPLVLRLIRSKLRKTLHLQGHGRHGWDTTAAQVDADLRAVRDQLVGPFLFGARPCSYDAAVSAFLWQAQAYPIDNAPRRAASAPELLAYVGEIRRRFWPELG